MVEIFLRLPIAGGVYWVRSRGVAGEPVDGLLGDTGQAADLREAPVVEREFAVITSSEREFSAADNRL